MSECPLCCITISIKDNQYIQGYQHIEHHIIICKHCYNQFKAYKKHKNFIHFSLLQSSINQNNMNANLKLRQFRQQVSDKISGLINNKIIENCFKEDLEQYQKSQHISLTTQDQQQNIENTTNSYEMNKTVQIVLDKCHEKVLEISQKIEPTKQTLISTKQSVIATAYNIKDKYRSLRNQYRNIKAELPPIQDIKNQAKKKLGSFLSFF